MKTMTIRDIRQRWPDAERALAQEGEVIVTRDSRPIARIVPFTKPRPRRTGRFDAAAYLRRLKRISKDDPPDMPSSAEILRAIRSRGRSLSRRK